MKDVAVTFEYEWLDDSSLRLRFLDQDDNILGQQIIGAEALLALVMAVNMADCQAADVDPERVWEVCKRCSIDMDLAAVLLEATRVRVGVTPEHQLRIDATKTNGRRGARRLEE